MRLALFIYCVVGALVLAGAIVLASTAAARLNHQYQQAHSELAQAQQTYVAAQDKLQQMQDAQRRDRARYTPQQAVQASFAVQEAQAAVQQANDRLASADAAQSRSKSERDRYLIAILPLGVFFFGHLLLAVMLRPRHGDVRPAVKRG